MRMINNDEDVKPIDPHELPVFEYQGPTVRETIQAAIVDFTILFVFNLLFFLGALFAFIRYDVR